MRGRDGPGDHDPLLLAAGDAAFTFEKPVNGAFFKVIGVRKFDK